MAPERSDRTAETQEFAERCAEPYAPAPVATIRRSTATSTISRRLRQNPPPTALQSTTRCAIPTSSPRTKTARPITPTPAHLPVGYTEDIFSALDIQDELQTLYTSGTVFHAFLGEKLPDWKAAASLVRKIAENYTPAVLHALADLFRLQESRLHLAASSRSAPICGSKDRGLQPYHRLLPPRAELERRKDAGVQGEKGLQH